MVARTVCMDTVVPRRLVGNGMGRPGHIGQYGRVRPASPVSGNILSVSCYRSYLPVTKYILLLPKLCSGYQSFVLGYKALFLGYQSCSPRLPKLFLSVTKDVLLGYQVILLGYQSYITRLPKLCYSVTKAMFSVTKVIPSVTK